MSDLPRLIPIGNFESEGLGHLTIPAGALERAAATLAAERLVVGDMVAKVGGDYAFAGVVVASFAKLGGAHRYVVENSDGLLHIFSAAPLSRRVVSP